MRSKTLVIGLFALYAFGVGCGSHLQTSKNDINTQSDSSGLKITALTTFATPWNECNSQSDTVFPDVHYFNGSLWCAVQNTRNELRILEIDHQTFTYKSEKTLVLAPGSLAFSRLGSFNNQLWVGYRNGAMATLYNVTTGVREDLGQSGGNDPITIGNGYVAWQDIGFNILKRPLAGGATINMGPGRPTGLGQIVSNGTVTLIDDERMAVSGGTRPCWAGNLVVIENHDGGLIARHDDGSEINLWPGRLTYTPRCTEIPGGWAVTTWGEHWSRTTILTSEDFQAPNQPSPAPIEAPVAPPESTPPHTSNSCTTPKPGAAWICINGGWVPPDHPAAQVLSPTPPVQTSQSCTTIQPGPTWVCVNGGWVPPDHPLAK